MKQTINISKEGSILIDDLIENPYLKMIFIDYDEANTSFDIIIPKSVLLSIIKSRYYGHYEPNIKSGVIDIKFDIYNNMVILDTVEYGKLKYSGCLLFLKEIKSILDYMIQIDEDNIFSILINYFPDVDLCRRLSYKILLNKSIEEYLPEFGDKLSEFKFIMKVFELEIIEFEEIPVTSVFDRQEFDDNDIFITLYSHNVYNLRDLMNERKYLSEYLSDEYVSRLESIISRFTMLGV